MFNLYSLLVEALSPTLGEMGQVVAHLIIFSLILLVGWITNTIARQYILKFLGVLVRKSKNTWDDSLFDRHVFDRLSHLAPAVVLYLGSELYPNTGEFVLLLTWMRRIAFLYITIISVSTLFALLDGINDIYNKYDMATNRPIKGYIQAIKVVMACMCLVVMVSLLTGRSPILILSGLGALTAVLLLIFKDTILGVVAGIQLAGNDMVRNGDWIEVPKHGADGDVIDVSLTTVKVQNWNKTITSVPIYSLVSDSFTNWRGMYESGGRRIKRSLTLDMRSVGFATDEMLEQLASLELIRGEVNQYQKGILDWRATHAGNQNVANEPRPTNVRLFRAYMSAYLAGNDEIHKDMTFLVRQLQPDSHGMPLEIYVFCKDQRWVEYEMVQAEIIEHLLAVMPQFNLRIFQLPSGHDLKQLMPGKP